MATAEYLSVGDGATSDYLNLNDGTAYVTRYAGVEWGEITPDGLRRITRVVNVYGATGAAVLANINAILKKGEQARAAVARRSITDAVSYGIQRNNGAMVYFDVLDLDLPLPPESLATIQVPCMQEVPIVLTCLAAARGAANTAVYSDVLTPGTAGSYFVAAPGGDVPALVTLKLTDLTESGHRINGLLIATRRNWGMADGDFTPAIDATAASGASTVADNDAVGGVYVRRAASSAWQDLATFSQPAAARNDGDVRLVARVRDNAVRLDAPTGLTVVLASPFIKYDPTGTTPLLVRGSTWESSDDTNLILNLPFAVPSGTLLVAVVGAADRTATLTPPAGWSTAIGPIAHATNAAAAWIVYKENAGPGDSGTVWQTSSAAGGLDINLIGFDGMLTSGALDDTGSSATGGDTTDTPAQANELAVGLCIDDGGASRLFKNPWVNIGNFQWDENASYNLGGNTALRWLLSTATWSTKLGAGTADVTVAASFKAKSTAVGYLPTGLTYEVCVAAKDAGGNIGPPSAIATVTVPSAYDSDQTPAALYAAWTAPAAGTIPTDYRVYYRASGGTWYYVEVGGVTTNKAITTFATAGDPPDYSTTRSQWRVKYGLSSGTTLHALGAVEVSQAGGVWERLDLGILPARLAQQGGSAPTWYAVVQGINEAGQTPNLDIDALWPVPAGPDETTLELDYAGDGTLHNLATPRIWLYDRRNDGRHQAQLLGTPITLTAANLSISSGAAVFNGTTSTLTAPTGSFGLDETQSWLAFRFKVTTLDDDPLFVWGDAAGTLIYAYAKAAGGIDLGRASGGNFAESANGAGTGLSSGNDATVIIAWDSDSLQQSINGADFAVAGSGPVIPTIASTTLRLFHDGNIFGGGAKFADATAYWVLGGTGTLSNADADTIHAFGNTGPVHSEVPTSAAMTLLWHAAWTTHAYGTASEAGEPKRPRGELTVGPGGTELTILPLIESGAFNIEHCRFRLELVTRPRFRYLAGS